MFYDWKEGASWDTGDNYWLTYLSDIELIDFVGKFELWVEAIAENKTLISLLKEMCKVPKIKCENWNDSRFTRIFD